MMQEYHPDDSDSVIHYPDGEPCQPGPNDYDPNYRREKLGNNRKKVARSVKRIKAKIAQKSRRKNRK